MYDVVTDTEHTYISQYFDECFKFIDDGKKQGGGVLVHCLVGKSWIRFICYPESDPGGELFFSTYIIRFICYSASKKCSGCTNNMT